MSNITNHAQWESSEGNGLALPWREHRIDRQVSLESIAQSTKISRRFLEAIERGEYDEMPGGVFRTSYIRQYAAETGYDAERILEHCREKLGGGERELRRDAGREKVAEARWVRFLSFG